MTGKVSLTPREDRFDELVDALTEIKQWCDAYPETIFRPVPSEKMKEATEALKEIGVDMGAMHAAWARHLVSGIGAIATKALAAEQRGEAP